MANPRVTRFAISHLAGLFKVRTEPGDGTTWNKHEVFVPCEGRVVVIRIPSDLVLQALPYNPKLDEGEAWATVTTKT